MARYDARMTPGRIGLLLSVIFTVVITDTAKAADEYVDVIDPTVRHQTIEYFTASDCWSMPKIGAWSEESRNKVADLLFSPTKGIGLSAWRFNLMAGNEPTRIRNSWRTGDGFEVAPGKYDWTRCAGQRWFLAAAKDRGVKTFIAFCNSPPMQLTVNGLTSVDPKADTLTSNLKPGMEPQYAAYLADILLHFRDNPTVAERVNFQWISPINEPQWDWTGGQEGTRNSNADIIRQYRAIADELAARHLESHILGPESGSIPDMYQPDLIAGVKHKAYFGDYIRAFADDSPLATAMDHCLAYHSYWSDGPKQLIHDREKLRESLDHHSDFRAVCSEYCVMEGGRDLGMDTALRTMRIVHADLTVVNAVGWSWWTAVSNGNYKDGLIYTDYRRPGDAQSIYPSKLLWALGNFSRFVRPGMVRVEIKSTGKAESVDRVMGSAYVDPANGKIVTVYINTTDQAVTLRLGLSNDKAVSWTPYLTSNAAGDDLRECPMVPEGKSFDLPGKSVATLISRR